MRLALKCQIGGIGNELERIISFLEQDLELRYRKARGLSADLQRPKRGRDQEVKTAPAATEAAPFHSHAVLRFVASAGAISCKWACRRSLRTSL